MKKVDIIGLALVWVALVAGWLLALITPQPPVWQWVLFGVTAAISAAMCVTIVRHARGRQS